MKLNWYHHSSRLGQLVIERQNVVADIVQHRPQTSTRHSPPVQSNEHAIYCWINWSKRFGLKLLNWAKKNFFFFLQLNWKSSRVRPRDGGSSHDQKPERQEVPEVMSGWWQEDVLQTAFPNGRVSKWCAISKWTTVHNVIGCYPLEIDHFLAIAPTRTGIHRCAGSCPGGG